MATSGSRGFHRLGLIFAVIVGSIGLLVIARDAVTLRLWEVTYGDIPVVVLGALIGLVVEIAVVCLAAYGLIRAIGWILDRIAAW
jgi:hypothetical protein